MRILLLTHSFNSLCQRLFLELTDLDYEVSIEFDISDEILIEAVDLFRPDLVIAPYLKREIPEAIWRQYLCLVVHPGIKGDRGPSALDWAIMNKENEWGVTVIQANGEMDGGDIWSSVTFPMRSASKTSLYHNEIAEAATQAILQAVGQFSEGGFTPEPLDYSRRDVRGRWRPYMKQEVRTIDWDHDNTATITRKIRAADGHPGVLDMISGIPCYLFNVFEEETLTGDPGTIIAQRNGAICRATIDGAVWITHLKNKSASEKTLKLPAAMLLRGRLDDTPESSPPLLLDNTVKTYSDIRYEEKNNVGYLYFDFYNGAMSTEQCNRLKDAYIYARNQGTRVIVLMGGPDYWSNGIHLNTIEMADSPADESWTNINAINDLANEIITTECQITISALQGNAGAGGAFLALAADRVYVRNGAIINPHYKGMGNLYGSEYWTYLLPRRVGKKNAETLTENRLPIDAKTAMNFGFVDNCFGFNKKTFYERIEQIAGQLASQDNLHLLLARKRRQRKTDEAHKSLKEYRAREMERMNLNFYGFDPSYHIARFNFVYKVDNSWTPLYLAKHRWNYWSTQQRRSQAPS